MLTRILEGSQWYLPGYVPGVKSPGIFLMHFVINQDKYPFTSCLVKILDIFAITFIFIYLCHTKVPCSNVKRRNLFSN